MDTSGRHTFDGTSGRYTSDLDKSGRYPPTGQPSRYASDVDKSGRSTSDVDAP